MYTVQCARILHNVQCTVYIALYPLCNLVERQGPPEIQFGLIFLLEGFPLPISFKALHRLLSCSIPLH